MPNDLHPVPTDSSSLAAAGFLARYREPTVRAYRNDLRCYWAWYAQHELQPLQAQRTHLELYLRDLQAGGYAPASTRTPRNRRPQRPPSRLTRCLGPPSPSRRA